MQLDLSLEVSQVGLSFVHTNQTIPEMTVKIIFLLGAYWVSQKKTPEEKEKLITLLKGFCLGHLVYALICNKLGIRFHN